MLRPLNPSRLDGAVAWITGSGGGLGRCHALLMAARGADIVVHDVEAEATDAVAVQIEALGRKAIAFHDSVTDADTMRRIAGTTAKALGPVTILVNNAGYGEHADIDEIDPDRFQRMFDVHVKGSFFCGQAVIPAMKEMQAGKIINISSIPGMTGTCRNSHHCGAKAALLGLTKAWARELAPWNILVNAVCPGRVTSAMPVGAQPTDRLHEADERVPLGRWRSLRRYPVWSPIRRRASPTS